MSWCHCWWYSFMSQCSGGMLWSLQIQRHVCEVTCCATNFKKIHNLFPFIPSKGWLFSAVWADERLCQIAANTMGQTEWDDMWVFMERSLAMVWTFLLGGGLSLGNKLFFSCPKHSVSTWLSVHICPIRDLGLFFVFFHRLRKVKQLQCTTKPFTASTM